METPQYLTDAYEMISACMWSADTFERAERRLELREKMASWERGLVAAEEFEIQFKKELAEMEEQERQSNLP